MISLDSNIIFSVLNKSDSNHKRASLALGEFSSIQLFVISPPVYAELRASRVWESSIEPFLETTGVQTLWQMPEDVWEAAAKASRLYSDLRKKRNCHGGSWLITS